MTDQREWQIDGYKVTYSPSVNITPNAGYATYAAVITLHDSSAASAAVAARIKSKMEENLTRNTGHEVNNFTTQSAETRELRIFDVQPRIECGGDEPVSIPDDPTRSIPELLDELERTPLKTKGNGSQGQAL